MRDLALYRQTFTVMNLNMLRAVALAGAFALPMAATTSAQPSVVIGSGLVTLQIVDVTDDIVVVISSVLTVFAPPGLFAANTIPNCTTGDTAQRRS
jgi:hypothetical protein